MVAGSGEEDCAVRFALGIQREEIQRISYLARSYQNGSRSL
jgi:hypothetical protein